MVRKADGVYLIEGVGGYFSDIGISLRLEQELRCEGDRKRLFRHPNFTLLAETPAPSWSPDVVEDFHWAGTLRLPRGQELKLVIERDGVAASPDELTAQEQQDLGRRCRQVVYGERSWSEFDGRFQRGAEMARRREETGER